MPDQGTSHSKREVCNRLRSLVVHVFLWPGVAGAILYVVLTINDNSSTGAALWVPAVLVPGASGMCLLFAGVAWLRQSSTPTRQRCTHCGYDLQWRNETSLRCPECGSVAEPTTAPTIRTRIIIWTMSMAALLPGIALMLFAFLYAMFIKAGVFDI